MSFPLLAAATPAAASKALPVATPAQLARIHHAAKAFEAQLIGQMLQPMFEGLQTNGTFDGGEAEGTWRSFMADAFGKQMAAAGGIGIAPVVEREMLRLQGLTEGPPA